MPANWQYNTQVPQQGSNSVGGGGGAAGQGPNGTVLAGFRSILDARIAMATGKTPDAQYPDGYLGSVIDRREDKLLQTVRNNARSYTRGVHKGSKIAPVDYFWPDDFNMMTVIENRQNGIKWTQPGNPIERLVHGGKFMSQAEANQLRQELNIPPDPQMKGALDPQVRKMQFKNLPAWK
jgi:hypothetical protein